MATAPRVSSTVRLTLTEDAAYPRVSSAVRLALYDPASNVRISMGVRLSLVEYAPCLTRRAQLWRFTRTDGEVLAFTSHDRPIDFGPLTYTPCSSLNASASESNSTIEGVSNQELTGILSDDAISQSDIEAGKYDDCFIEVFLVAWGDASDEVISVDSVRRLMAGWAGTLSAGDEGFKAEVLGPGAKIAQKAITATFAPGCRWVFGDANCTVDIDALKLEAVVDTVSDNGEFTLLVTPGTSGATFEQGFIRWLDGVNAGTDTEVKSIDFATGDVATVVLWSPAPFLPSAGDTVEIFPGCDRTKPACQAYDNFDSYGGYPDVPGSDALVETPEAKY